MAATALKGQLKRKSFDHEPLALVLDCSNHWLVAGLFGTVKTDEKIAFEKVELAPRQAFQRFPLMLRELLDQAGVQHPDWIGCTIGPGSFTGARICVSTARNLAQLWNLPALGCDTLSYMARQIMEDETIDNDRFTVALDGRQRQIYWYQYDSENMYDRQSEFREIEDSDVGTCLLKTKKNGVVFVDDIPQVQSYIKAKDNESTIVWKSWPTPRACVLYEHLLALGGKAAAADWYDLLPLYIRDNPAQASHPRGFTHQG